MWWFTRLLSFSVYLLKQAMQLNSLLFNLNNGTILRY